MAKGSKTTDRASIRRLTEIVNVGKSVADDLGRIGVRSPQQLIGRDPWALYQTICAHDGVLHDPCLLDVFMASIDYMNGKPPKKWWEYTAKRKRLYTAQLKTLTVREAGPARVARNKKRRGQKATA